MSKARSTNFRVLQDEPAALTRMARIVAKTYAVVEDLRQQRKGQRTDANVNFIGVAKYDATNARK